MNLSDDAIRHLLYPLGFIASICFGLRFAWQWLRSERSGISLVDAIFWRISMVGNTIMALHYFIQIHFALCAFQCINGFLAWRNLKLLQSRKSLSPIKRLLSLFLIICICASFFLLQSWLCLGFVDWVRSPHTHMSPHAIGLRWHLLGFLGALIFNLRFWLQWWHAEQTNCSHLKPWFWWLSFIGATILCLYAYMMDDPVTLLANLLPLLGYVRNIMLIRQASNRNPKPIPERRRGAKLYKWLGHLRSHHRRESRELP